MPKYLLQLFRSSVDRKCTSLCTNRLNDIPKLTWPGNMGYHAVTPAQEEVQRISGFPGPRECPQCPGTLVHRVGSLTGQHIHTWGLCQYSGRIYTNNQAHSRNSYRSLSGGLIFPTSSSLCNTSSSSVPGSQKTPFAVTTPRQCNASFYLVALGTRVTNPFPHFPRVVPLTFPPAV